ncbi:MAG TPA: hypothetical protein DCE41_36035 [Cytophagales bacterium]|nr:hypothetical protein [Cytophagales bacterium]HAP64601.1 hypothetical protein [Cytophagales bacterium]
MARGFLRPRATDFPHHNVFQMKKRLRKVTAATLWTLLLIGLTTSVSYQPANAKSEVLLPHVTSYGTFTYGDWPCQTFTRCDTGEKFQVENTFTVLPILLYKVTFFGQATECPGAFKVSRVEAVPVSDCPWDW